ncbi:hypothetical protein M9458_054774, partial [Cirrhinus mrigala]
HNHLHCFERVQLQVVITTPDSQLLKCASICKLITILDEADNRGFICKLDRGVCRSAAIGVEEEEQWGENTPL